MPWLCWKTRSSLSWRIGSAPAVAVNENILKAGEDVAVGQEVLPAGARLRPAEIGGLMALGFTETEVVRRPKIESFPAAMRWPRRNRV